MTRRFNLKDFCISLLIFIFTSFCFAEPILNTELGYSLDIPEGYKLADYTEDGMSYLFTHPNIPVSLALKVVYNDNVKSTSEALELSLKKLNAMFQADQFAWNNTPCSISTFNMKLDQNYSGWATATPTKIDNAYLVLLCYSPSDKKDICEQFIISTLNSLCIDDYYYNTPGIITTYAFPLEGNKKINLKINGRSISTKIDKIDEEASQFVVDLEYSVLTLYAKHNAWKEAWQRYYRMIYRDSYSRMQNVSTDLYNAFFEECKEKNPLTAEISYAQILLSWTQNFNYIRANEAKQSDFTSIPSAIAGKGSDCDSRSLLLCVLLKSIGIETLLLFSPEYSHAIAATQIDAPGQKYHLDGVEEEFIFGETTAKVTWGMIAQEHSDRSKWIPVILP